MTALSNLLTLLDVEKLEDNLFRGQSEDIGTRSVFGGQVLAQSLAAARRTVDSARMAHSMHAYFILPGDHQAPIIYDVDRIRDGGSFTTRRVVAIQHGRPIFNMSASFQVPEDGFSHQEKMPDVEGPQNLPSLSERYPNLPDELPKMIRRWFSEDQAILFKPVEDYNPFWPEKTKPVRHVWFKANGDLPDDAGLHRELLSYFSDFSLLGTATLPHAISPLHPELIMASLDHAMWFHREFRMDNWLLYALTSPNASGSRGLGTGRIYTQHGTLVASVTQEGLMRVRKSPA